MTHLLSLLLTTVVTIGKQPAVPVQEAGFFAGLLAFLLLPWVFYLILTIAVIALITLHENEEIGWSHTVFILLAAYLCFKFDMGYKDIFYNPLPILKWIGVYLILGIVWAFFKWYFYLKNILTEFNDYKNSIELTKDFGEKINKEFINNLLFEKYRYATNSIKINRHVVETIEIEYPERSRNKKEEFKIHKYEIINPQANNYKALITTWITHWPVSLVWTLINDPIKKLINHIFEFIKSVFQSISDKVFKSVKVDL